MPLFVFIGRGAMCTQQDAQDVSFFLWLHGDRRVEVVVDHLPCVSSHQRLVGVFHLEGESFIWKERFGAGSGELHPTGSRL